MSKVQIRTTKKEGDAPLYMRMKIGEDAVWVNLLLKVDVGKWNAVVGNERKTTNLLDRLGHSKKISEIEFAIKDLRKRHRLTKETVSIAIDSIVMAEKRATILEKEELREKVVKKYKYRFKNCLDSYVNSAVDGTRRHSYGDSFSEHSIKILKQFRRIMFNYLDTNPFEWSDLNKLLVDRFISYLEGLGYCKSTIERYMGAFHAFVLYAEQQG